MSSKIGKALVVGAGIAGIRAALDLAQVGYGVTLVDRSAHLGGILSQLDYQFPTDHCGMCKMLPLVDRDAGSQYCLRKGLFHENIEILLATELISLEGEPGSFRATVTRHFGWVDADRCVGCGACVDVCPVEVADAFNAGMSVRKAIYLPVPHAIPNPYVIDVVACTVCGACQAACPTAAIQLPEGKRAGFRILVVDDELVVRDSLKEWLVEEGFAVDMAASGAEALEKLAGQSYQLMLVDIKMPGMDGVEVLQKAKENFADLKVIMMTAYATVDTAVEAMKIGALDYLVKPFDPEVLIPMVARIFQDMAAAEGRQLEIDALVLCGGTDFVNPASGKNLYGYGVYPNVVTGLELERMVSGTGPCAGHLVRPSDGKTVQKIAWIQCVGSRDLPNGADFCSNVCCMYAVKEARLVKEKYGTQIEAAIFFMDMRTFGKPFQRYRDEAQQHYGIRFNRARVHSLIEADTGDDLLLRSVDLTGAVHEECFDLVVLSLGQRPAAGTAQLAETLELGLNPWGFVESVPFSPARTARPGVFLGGSFSGLRDISESVTLASAAAANASRVIHAAGGSLVPAEVTDSVRTGDPAAMPKILTVVCTCGDKLSQRVNTGKLAARLKTDPAVCAVEFIEQACTAEGWENLVERVKQHHPNRLLIGACMPYVYGRKLHELGRQTGLDAALMEVVDLKMFGTAGHGETGDKRAVLRDFLSGLETGLAGVKWADPQPAAGVPVCQRALVVGGGIAGMTAALMIADHGFPVDLVECSEKLGGNLNWLQYTLEGNDPRKLLEDTCAAVEKHSKIKIYRRAEVIHAYGQVGNFHSTIQEPEAEVRTIDHGVVVLATGGSAADTTAYEYGSCPAVITQKQLEEKLTGESFDPTALNTVVMIQCVDCREEPRNYCSRVCCAGALKHALKLNEQNPAMSIYILYRDMMTYGFNETYFTRARENGIMFIQYRPEEKPQVQVNNEAVTVQVFEPIIGKKVAIYADLLVLATGITPNFPAELARSFGAAVDRDGFFQSAEHKWRPVDSLTEGVFACGLALAPGNIGESTALAEAAAQRALGILARRLLPAAKVVAGVHHSLCSLCERCIEACPYGARTIDPDHEQVLVNAAMCQGCGSCAAVCPNSAAVLEGFLEQQMFEVIDAAIQ